MWTAVCLIQYGMVQKEVQSPLSTQYITTRFIYIEKGRSLLMQELHSFIIFDHTCLLCWWIEITSMRACLLEGRGIPTMLLFPEVLQETSCTAFTRRVFIPARTTNLRDGQWQERGRSLLLRQHARADPALPNGIRQPGWAALIPAAVSSTTIHSEALNPNCAAACRQKLY